MLGGFCVNSCADCELFLLFSEEVNCNENSENGHETEHGVDGHHISLGTFIGQTHSGDGWENADVSGVEVGSGGQFAVISVKDVGEKVEIRGRYE